MACPYPGHSADEARSSPPQSTDVHQQDDRQFHLFSSELTDRSSVSRSKSIAHHLVIGISGIGEIFDEDIEPIQ